MWTPEKVQIVKDCVSAHADNLTYAFEVAAPMVGKSQKAVSGCYYQKIRRGEEKLTALMTNRGVAINVKNTIRREPDVVIETLNFLLLKLTKAQKLELIKTLLT